MRANCECLFSATVIENLDLKEKLYTELGALCKPETIFASNTSSLSIMEMAQFSGRLDRFVGVHFFNPVQVGSERKDVVVTCFSSKE